MGTVMNADQIKRKRILRRTCSNDTAAMERLEELLQRKPPARTRSASEHILPAVNTVKISTDSKRPSLERQVSRLGMEDPTLEPAKQARANRGITASSERSVEELEDNHANNAQEEGSVASDPTANEDNEGIDMVLFQASLGDLGYCSGSSFYGSGHSTANCSSSHHGDEHNNNKLKSLEICPLTNSTHSKSHLALPNIPPTTVELQLATSEGGIVNIDEVLEICKNLDAVEIQQFNEQQRQQYLARKQNHNNHNPHSRQHSLNGSTNSSSHGPAASENGDCDAQHNNNKHTNTDQQPHSGRRRSSKNNSINSSAYSQSSTTASNTNEDGIITDSPRSTKQFTPRRNKRVVRKLHITTANISNPLT